MDSSRSSSIAHPGRGPLAHDLVVPVGLRAVEPVAYGGRDRRTHLLGGRDLGLGGRPDRVHRAELGRQRTRSGRADVPDRQRDDHPPQRHVLGLVEVLQHLLPVGRELRAVLTLLRRAGEQVGPHEGVAVEVEHVALVLDHPALPECVRRLGAQPLDVEGAPACDVEDAIEQLGGHVWWLGQRRSLSPSFSCDQRGAARRRTRSASPTAPARRGAAPSTGPRISGITSPALRRITVSPGRTSLRFTSWALCRVARSTVEPATLVGSITPNGVTRPVRPVLARISRSLALTSSGGYL